MNRILKLLNELHGMVDQSDEIPVEIVDKITEIKDEFINLKEIFEKCYPY